VRGYALLRSGCSSDTSPPAGRYLETLVVSGQPLPAQRISGGGKRSVSSQRPRSPEVNVLNQQQLDNASGRASSPSRSRASLRTRCLSTKVTDAEYHTFERLARGQSLSEWIRRALRDHVSRRELEEIVVAELLALRAILLNLQFAVAVGTPPTADEMRQLIERADEDRFRKAQERLAAAAVPRSW